MDYLDFADYQTSQHTFESLAVSTPDVFTLVGHGDPERVAGLYVSGSFFKVFGRPSLVGRPLTEEDDQPGAKPMFTQLSALFPMCNITVLTSGKHRIKPISSIPKIPTPRIRLTGRIIAFNGG